MLRLRLLFCLCVLLQGDVSSSVLLRPYQHNHFIAVDPLVQHVPLPPFHPSLRPPPPRVSAHPTVFIGLASFRDAQRCGKTVFLAYKRATHPKQIYIGLVDQTLTGDGHCLEEYCKLATKEWGECRYQNQIRVKDYNADESRGPMYMRHFQQQLIQSEEFCLQVDAHTAFTNQWEEMLIADWKRANNEMAVLTHYPHNMRPDLYNDETGEHTPPASIPHLCSSLRGKFNSLVRNNGASLLFNPVLPQLSAMYGAGFAFSKCHAEKRALIDPYAKRIFDGEEFMRASLLFTNGYDMYTPSSNGSVLYHNYTTVPYRFELISNISREMKKKEEEMGVNRCKLKLGIPFEGYVSTYELDKYAYGSVRSLNAYRKFSGIQYQQLDNKSDVDSCRQLHWMPYENATEIEELLPNWKWTIQNGEESEAKKESEETQESQEKQNQKIEKIAMNGSLRNDNDTLETPTNDLSYLSIIVLVILSAIFIGSKRYRKAQKYKT